MGGPLYWLYRDLPDGPVAKNRCSFSGQDAMRLVERFPSVRTIHTMGFRKYLFVLAASFVLIIATLGALHYFLFAHLEREAKARTFQQLDAIGTLKVGQIQAYARERKADAAHLAGILQSSAGQKWLSAPHEPLPEPLRQALEATVVPHGYKGLVIADPEGNIRWSFRGMRVSDVGKVLARRASAERAPILSDLYLEAQASGNHPAQDVAAPILSPDGARVMGVVLIACDPDGLFALVQTWPIVSESAESLLSRRDGEQVLFLNELRHQQNTALKLRVPLALTHNDPAYPAVCAALGQEEHLEAIDYRGVPVLARTLRVPELGWGMVVKIDSHEALREVFRLKTIVLTSSAIIGLLLLALAGSWLRWRQLILRREEALRDSEHRLQAIFDGTPDGILVADTQTRQVLAGNKAMSRMIGVSPAELLQLGFESLHPPATLPALSCQFAAMARGELQDVRDVPLLCKDGSTIPVDIRGTCLRIGNRTCNLGVFHDITERKRAEEALQRLAQDLESQVAERTQSLRASEERLRAIVNTAADTIITINAQGIVVSVNPAAERMFGYTASEMIGQNVKMLMPSPHREQHDGYLANYKNTGFKHIIGVGREVQGQRKDGSLFPLELAVSEVGHLGLFTGILRDVSRRKALERQVVEIASQEEQRIGRELHDSVGQELTGLGMMAGALARRLKHGAGTEEELASKLTQGLNRVHQQVRALSREWIMAELDAEGLHVALDELAARTREQSGIDCHFDCAETVSVPDPHMAKQLYRIAQEAVSNALRHGKPSHICLTLHSGPAELRLTIRDDGIGLQKPVALSQAAAPEGGMGIPTMQYRAAMIGGELLFGPAEGEGTLVSCIVPWRTSHGQE